MSWFTQLFFGNSIAQSVVALSLAIVLGLAIGLIRFKGIRLGVGGVLFSGLALAHFGIKIDHAILEFAREFGLILFVFTIGMQVGPGFADSLRRRGMRLNLMAGLIVVLGTLVTVGMFFLLDLPMPVAVGLLSGAVTNTPSLAASSQVFNEIMPGSAAQAIGDAGLGYAIAYPFGIFGIILVMLLVRLIFRIDPAKELAAMEEQDRLQYPPLLNATFTVVNPNLYGMALREVPDLEQKGFVLSRIKEPDNPAGTKATDKTTGEAPNEITGNGAIHAATPETVLQAGMLVHAVGQASSLEKLRVLIGPRSELALQDIPGPFTIRHLLVTHSRIAGKGVRELGLTPESGVTVTRIIRAGTEFTPGPGVHLHYGDKLICVGEDKDLDRAERIVGNSAKALDHPHVLPIFLGILLGTILGSIPIAVPGLPSGLKLGLAGGPLLVAILLSRINHFAGMVWYLPTGANLILREVGISLFLACVGLNAGGRFISTVLEGSGVQWMLAGICITFIPLFTAALIGRILLKCNYASMCGLLAGSMTDPPALAFAVQMMGSDSPSSVYATVYPLTMILRILMGQLLVIGLYYYAVL